MAECSYQLKLTPQSCQPDELQPHKIWSVLVRNLKIPRIVMWTVVCVSFAALPFQSRAADPTSTSQPSAYDLLLSKGNSLMKQGKLPDALAATQVAIEIDGNRFEAHR